MSSPFLNVANAKLTFKVSGDALTEDSKGNVVPVEEWVTMMALLQESKNSAKVLPYNYPRAKLGLKAKVLEGYLVDPLELPLSIRPICTGYAEIRVATNRIELGKFELMLTQQNPFVVSAGVKEVTKIVIIFMMEDVREV